MTKRKLDLSSATVEQMADELQRRKECFCLLWRTDDGDYMMSKAFGSSTEIVGMIEKAKFQILRQSALSD